jgi:hypothetical protein
MVRHLESLDQRHDAAPLLIRSAARGRLNAREALVADLKETLAEVLEAVENGGTVEIREGENAVAAVFPGSLPAHISLSRPLLHAPTAQG